MKKFTMPMTRRVFAVLGLLATTSPLAWGQAQLASIADMVLDDDALIMPNWAPYGRAINGVSFQTEALLTYNGYQYATWYHLGESNEHIYVARRDLATNTWESFDTGATMVNGDGTGSQGSSAWDAHNVVSMGISGDGRLHFSFDMHGSWFNYINSDPGVATNPAGTAWNASILNPETNVLNAGENPIPGVTYPRFITKPGGDMVMTYRTGGSGNGDVRLATFDAQTGLWDTPHIFVDGTSNITYNDPVGSSNNRNAYLNGLDIDANGRLHTTWTWRESAGGANHDIMYAYSDDGGDTWHNNAGTVIGSVGSPIDLNSPGLIIDDGDAGNGLLGQIDRRQTLMNQQAQAVDLDGGVHALMWHRRFDEAGYEWQPGDPPFYTNDAAHYHYYRDPDTGDWTRNQLPTSENVSSRPKLGYDAMGNLFAVYVSPDVIPNSNTTYYADGNLVIAGATKAANYTDWTILATDDRDFVGEPMLDQDRLLSDNILSIFLQETAPDSNSPLGSPLHVLEYSISGLLAEVPGDYDGSGQVEQADLDFVLQNWGDTNVSDVTGWVNFAGLPGGGIDGQVEQTELDLVLSNWGDTGVDIGGGSGNGGGFLTVAPEPGGLPMLAAVAGVWARRGRRRCLRG